MDDCKDSETQCPYHRMVHAVRDTGLLRTAVVANVSLMRIARDFVDRRLVRLQKES
jgi:hypothetical protein